MSDAGCSPQARRVLLVVANREQFPEPAFPVGALYVARAVEAAGGRARVFDAGLYRRPLAALRAELTEWRPDVVGLSLRNADNAAWPHTNTYTEWYARVADTVRAAAPGAGIVLGGPAFSIFPREIRRALLVADGVVGDGEPVARRMATGAALGGVVEELLPDLADVGLPGDLGAVFPGAHSATAPPACRRRGAARTAACTAPIRGSRARGCAGARRRMSRRRWSASAATSAPPSSSWSTRRSTPTRTT